MFSCKFWGICKNAFFAEQHRTTASDYSSINSSEVVLANETVNYDTKALREKCLNSKSLYYGVNLRIQSEHWKIRTVQVKEQVSEAVVRRPQFKCT